MKKLFAAVLIAAVVTLAGVTVHARTHVTDSACWLCDLCPF
jgi:hypothetical protein